MSFPLPNLRAQRRTYSPTTVERNAWVLELADAGQTVEEIARRVGRSPATVATILRNCADERPNRYRLADTVEREFARLMKRRRYCDPGI